MVTANRSSQAARAAIPGLLSGGDDESLVIRRVVVQPRDVVYLKGILEASRGLATLLAEQGGELVLVTTESREIELDELIDDLADEISLRRRSRAGGPSATRVGGEQDHG